MEGSIAPLPVGRSAHTAVLLHGSVYVGGGFEGSSGDKKAKYQIFIMCMPTEWVPFPLLHHNCSYVMIVLEDKLIFAGGDEDSVVTDKVHVLDHGEWKDYSRMPTALTSLSAVGYQSMSGGTIKVKGKQVRLATTELLDTTNGCWHTCDDLPVPRNPTVVCNTLYLYIYR